MKIYLKIDECGAKSNKAVGQKVTPLTVRGILIKHHVIDVIWFDI